MFRTNIQNGNLIMGSRMVVIKNIKISETFIAANTIKESYFYVFSPFAHLASAGCREYGITNRGIIKCREFDTAINFLARCYFLLSAINIKARQ